jgi:hypothetical protein
MVLSLAIALFLITYGTNWVTRGVLHRYWGAEARITVHPWIALLAVVGVIIARALDFSPGFLIGVVIGLELLRAGRNAQVAGVMVRFGLILALALVGWIGYSIMDAFGEPEGFAPALVRETFVALTAEGLIALLVGALPLKFLEGRELWEKSKPLWGATFLVVAVAFSLLVLPTAAEETTVGDIGLWAIVLVSFAAITLTIWAVFARIESRERAREQREKRESVDA